MENPMAEPVKDPTPNSAAAVQRTRNWDGVAAIIAALVGLLALCVSGYTAYIQRQQVRAQVWPYLEPGVSGAQHEIVLFNKGVGPAIVRSLQIFVDGKPQRDWDQIYAALGLKFEHKPPYSTVNGVVLSPNDRIDVVIFQSGDDFNAFIKQADRMKTRLCYCSTLNECWVYDEREKDQSRRYREIDFCPAKSKDNFIDNEAAEATVPRKESQ